nr:uncharacterized protein LOC113825055 [Penaeus vannamei]
MFTVAPKPQHFSPMEEGPVDSLNMRVTLGQEARWPLLLFLYTMVGLLLLAIALVWCLVRAPSESWLRSWRHSAGGKSELADVIIVTAATPPPQSKHEGFFEVLHKPVDANTDIERGVRESLPREDPSSQGI